ncbi:MAG: amidohydrolase family protein [Oscillospiraceae bacterium]|nr:amidohydrolase family protein [Oscillospiraceae bacterium]
MSDILDIIDAHCHVFPDPIAEKSRGAVGAFYELPMYTSGTLHNLKQERDRVLEFSGRKFRVARQLICSPAVTGHQTASINAFLSELIRQDPALTAFGTLHPENADYAEILRNFRSQGLVGLKLHSDFQRFPIDDPAMYPVYREAANLGLPVLFHMGDRKLDFSHPRRLRKVLDDIPELTAIAAHMGGYSHWKEALELLEPSDRLYFDISSTLQFVDGALVQKFLHRFGETQFFFGSDFPMWDPAKELERLLSFGFPDEVLQKLLIGNFEQFLAEHCGT